MLYVCIRGVMDVVFSFCIVTRGAVGARVFCHAIVVWLCLVCILWQFSMLHDLQFVNAGRGCKRQPYGRSILQSLSHDCLIGSCASRRGPIMLYYLVFIKNFFIWWPHDSSLIMALIRMRI